jgi:DNA-directed RNA polymerase subunit M/transcription elongation factor TFIIS
MYNIYMINKDKRKNIFKELSKKFGNEYSKDIETSIYIFSQKYADDNGTPFLLENIYDSKSDEILSILNNKNLMFIIQAIKKGDIDPKKIAFMKASELNPDKFKEIIKRKEVEEMRLKDKGSTSTFECKKCKKNKTSVIEKQVRSGDEPATLFITCLECGHVFTM